MSEINGGLYRNDLETRSLGSPYRRSQSIHDVHRRPIPIQSEAGSDIYSKPTIYLLFSNSHPST